jgi:hypothetical protein
MPALDADAVAKLEALGRIVPFDSARQTLHRDAWSAQILDDGVDCKARFWIDVVT